MNIILIAVIILVAYFIVDIFLSKISIIGSMPGKSWSLGVGWFLILLLINLGVIIFVIVYYYTRDDKGQSGPLGETGRQGISGSEYKGCPDCNFIV